MIFSSLRGLRFSKVFCLLALLFYSGQTWAQFGEFEYSFSRSLNPLVEDSEREKALDRTLQILRETPPDQDLRKSQIKSLLGLLHTLSNKVWSGSELFKERFFSELSVDDAEGLIEISQDHDLPSEQQSLVFLALGKIYFSTPERRRVSLASFLSSKLSQISHLDSSLAKRLLMELRKDSSFVTRLELVDHLSGMHPSLSNEVQETLELLSQDVAPQIIERVAAVMPGFYMDAGFLKKLENSKWEKLRDVAQNLLLRWEMDSAFPSDVKSVVDLNQMRTLPCSDTNLSSLILHSAFLRKDSRLTFRISTNSSQTMYYNFGRHFDSFKARCLNENSSFYIRRKFIESFSNISSHKLVTRIRHLAVVLGGEHAYPGIDPEFSELRKISHLFVPDIVDKLEEYIQQKKEQLLPVIYSEEQVPDKFKEWIAGQGSNGLQDQQIALQSTGNYSESPLNILYALEKLLLGYKKYYGFLNRFPMENGVFAEGLNWGELRKTVDSLQSALEAGDPKESFEVALRLAFEQRAQIQRHRKATQESVVAANTELELLRSYIELLYSLKGWWAAARMEYSDLDQAKKLVDLLYVEGLYSGQQREKLLEELEEIDSVDSRNADRFYRFLSYMYGLAYSKVDSSLGLAAKSYAHVVPEAADFVDLELRKSSLQAMGLLQLEVKEKNRDQVAGKKEILVPGVFLGKLKIFESQREIQEFLEASLNRGADTIWVLGKGLSLPNSALFRGVIAEEGLVRGSHYEVSARNQSLPLVVFPGAVSFFQSYEDEFLRFDSESLSPQPETEGQRFKLEPSSDHSTISEISGPCCSDPNQELVELYGNLSDSEIRELRKRIGSKAANYGFLVRELPTRKGDRRGNIHPGFAVPFGFYNQHVLHSGARDLISQIDSHQGVVEPRLILKEIRHRIARTNLPPDLMEKVMEQIKGPLRTHFPNHERIKLRFRSSSSVEDRCDFSGAGLYQSHGVEFEFQPKWDNFDKISEEMSQAIKKVWASLWTEEAYQARLRAGLSENPAMGVLVHPNYKDEESTGVAYFFDDENLEIMVHRGSENIQNPSIIGLNPEYHLVRKGRVSVDLSVETLFTGDKILSKKDRKKLLKLLRHLAPRFRKLYPNERIEGIDFEFKVMEFSDEGGKEDRVYVKQLRPLRSSSKSDVE